MTQIHPGDLLQIAANGRFYYVIVLDRIRMFGGQLCFVVYRTSAKPLTSDEIMRSPLDGFYEIVDFIWAKRENRIVRAAKKLAIDELNRGLSFFKNAHATKEKAKDWWIYDRQGRELRRVQTLTDEEKRYPLYHRIDDVLMVSLVDKRWAPENDPRI